jgi:hypothetical protein
LKKKNGKKKRKKRKIGETGNRSLKKGLHSPGSPRKSNPNAE